MMTLLCWTVRTHWKNGNEEKEGGDATTTALFYSFLSSPSLSSEFVKKEGEEVMRTIV